MWLRRASERKTSPKTSAFAFILSLLVGSRAGAVVPPENAVTRRVEHEVLAYLGRGGLRATHWKRSRGTRGGGPAAVEARLAALRDLDLECRTIERSCESRHSELL